MFLSWDSFINRLTQIFKNLETIIIAEQKIQELT